MSDSHAHDINATEYWVMDVGGFKYRSRYVSSKTSVENLTISHCRGCGGAKAQADPGGIQLCLNKGMSGESPRVHRI